MTRRQHGVVTREQLLRLGMSPGAIRARLRAGRLHRLWPGLYAVGRPDVGRFGHLMAATLVCGPDARLSHRSAAELWRNPLSVLIDLAAEMPTEDVEDAVNEADRLDLIRTHRLHLRRS